MVKLEMFQCYTDIADQGSVGEKVSQKLYESRQITLL